MFELVVKISLQVLKREFVLFNLIALIRHFQLLPSDAFLEDLCFTFFGVNLTEDFVKFLQQKLLISNKADIFYIELSLTDPTDASN